MTRRDDFLTARFVEPHPVGTIKDADSGKEIPVFPNPPLKDVIITIRDRIGFRYERRVTERDCVSQAQAAAILGVPVMRINRWINSDELKETTKSGFSVVRLCDLYTIAWKYGIILETRPKGRWLVG